MNQGDLWCILVLAAVVAFGCLLSITSSLSTIASKMH